MEGWSVLSKLLSLSPCPRLKKKKKIAAWILSTIVGSQVWGPILGVLSCLPSAKETPRGNLALRGVGLVWAVACQAQVLSPPSPERGLRGGGPAWAGQWPRPPGPRELLYWGRGWPRAGRRCPPRAARAGGGGRGVPLWLCLRRGAGGGRRATLQGGGRGGGGGER